MDTRSYDIVVLGNEPQGLWLLTQALEKFSALPLKKKPAWLTHPEPRLLWIQTPLPLKTEFLPKTVALKFGVPFKEVYSVEFLAPLRTFRWNPENLEARWGISQKLITSFPDSKERRNAIRFVLKQSPEILGYASALVHRYCRTDALQPETILSNAFLLSELVEWRPSETLPEGIHREAWPNTSEAVKILESRAGIELKWENQAIHTDYLILNTDRDTACKYLGESIYESFQKSPAFCSNSRLYPLKVKSNDRAISLAAQKYSIILDSEEIPDPKTETWPLEVHRNAGENELTLWVDSREEASIESLSESLRSGFQRLNRVFPHLPYHLKTVEPPLGLDLGYEEETSAPWEKTLRERSRETFRLTSLISQTRSRRIWDLSSGLETALPYPMGPLKHAYQVLRTWIPARALRQSVASESTL